jgi:hypothetical protein
MGVGIVAIYERAVNIQNNALKSAHPLFILSFTANMRLAIGLFPTTRLDFLVERLTARLMPIPLKGRKCGII